MVPRLTDCGAWLASSAKEYIPNHAADYVDANAQTARMQRREMQQSPAARLGNWAVSSGAAGSRASLLRSQSIEERAVARLKGV